MNRFSVEVLFSPQETFPDFKVCASQQNQLAMGWGEGALEMCICCRKTHTHTSHHILSGGRGPTRDTQVTQFAGQLPTRRCNLQASQQQISGAAPTPRQVLCCFEQSLRDVCLAGMYETARLELLGVSFECKGYGTGNVDVITRHDHESGYRSLRLCPGLLP